MVRFLFLQWLITQLVTRYPDVIQMFSLVLYLDTNLCLNWNYLNFNLRSIFSTISLFWFSFLEIFMCNVLKLLALRNVSKYYYNLETMLCLKFQITVNITSNLNLVRFKKRNCVGLRDLCGATWARPSVGCQVKIL